MPGSDFACNNAGSIREMSTAAYKTEAALQAAVIAAIYAAVALNQTFNCTVSVSGYTQQDIQNVVRVLMANGFSASQAGSTLTITW